MMKRLNRKIAAAVLMLVLVIGYCFNVSADVREYANTDTNYRAIIEDDAELLADLDSILAVMEPITKYGDVLVKTIDENYTNEIRYARECLHDHFGTKSCTIVLIDMDNRKICVYSDGAIYKTVTSSKADSITDNVYRYASREEYDDCITEALREIYVLLEGGRIAEPMHIIGVAFISILLGMIVCFLLMNEVSGKKKASDKELVKKGTDTSVSITLPEAVFIKTTKRKIERSSGGSFGGGGGFSGGGGGGFSGGGGGGGFSGGGGGGGFSGGGGSHGF